MRVPLGILIGLVALCIFVPLTALGPIGGSSEAREAHIAQIILDQGEWILPLRNGILPSKPPLYHWLAAMAASALQSDVSPALARLPSALCASLILALVASLAVLIARRGPHQLAQRDATFAVLSCGVLAGSYGFTQLALDARVDMTYALFFFAAVGAILHGIVRNGEVSQKDWCAFFVCAAFAVLAKGPLGFVLPAILVFALLAVNFGFKAAIQECFRPRWAWLIFIALALPWYYAAWQRGSAAFLDRQLVFENVKRLVGGEDVNSEPWWFYLPSLLRTAFPWSFIFVFASLDAARQWKEGRAGLSSYKNFSTLKFSLLVAFWVGLAVFTCASGKRHAYLVPLFPLLALSVSLWLMERWLRLDELAQARLLLLCRGFLTISLLVAILMAGAPEILPALSFKSLSVQLTQAWLVSEAQRIQLYAVVLIAVILVALWGPRNRFIFSAPLALAGVLALSAAVGIGAKNYLKGFEGAGRDIAAQVAAQDRLVFVREARNEFFDPLMYYVRRPADTAAIRDMAILPGQFLVYQAKDNQDLSAKLKQDNLLLTNLATYNLPDDLSRGRKDREYYLSRVVQAP